jgi:hypothetical protein
LLSKGTASTTEEARGSNWGRRANIPAAKQHLFAGPNAGSVLQTN